MLVVGVLVPLPLPDSEPLPAWLPVHANKEEDRDALRNLERVQYVQFNFHNLFG